MKHEPWKDFLRDHSNASRYLVFNRLNDRGLFAWVVLDNGTVIAEHPTMDEAYAHLRQITEQGGNDGR